MNKKHRVKNEQHHIRDFGWHRAIPAWLSCLLICTVGILAYSNTFQSAFHFDDETSILQNPAIRHLNDLQAIFYYAPSRFVTYLSFAVNYAADGVSVIGYHIVNLAIHLLAGLMVWLFARQMLRTPAIKESDNANASSLVPLLAGLIFVAHPVQTQAVAYIAQRAASLATLFYLLSLYLYGEARRTQVANGSRWWVAGFYAAAFVAAIVGMFSKETALTLPFAVILYEMFFFRGGRKTIWVIIGLSATIFLLIPVFLAGRGLISLTIEDAVPATQYLLTQPRVWLTYLRLLILPINQNLDYDFALSRSLLDASTLLSMGVLGLLAFFAGKLFRKKRLLSFCFFWFFLTLLPESSILPMPDVIYEHRLYLPMVGLSVLVALLIYEFSKTWRSATLATLLVGLIGILGLATRERNKVWSDNILLWTDVISKSPDKARGYNNRGKAFIDKNMLDAALLDLNHALVLAPSFGDAYNNRGNVYLLRGEYDKAIAEYQNALRVGISLGTKVDQVFYNLGTAYIGRRDFVKAIEYLNHAMSANPIEPTYLYNRALAYSELNEEKRSLADYDRALRLNPRYVKAYNNRGLLLEQMGDLDAALSDISEAIRLDPTFHIALVNRARILSSKGEYEKSVLDYAQAITQVPSSAELYNRRGMVYLKIGSFDKALQDLQNAVRLDSRFREAYFNQGLVLSAEGKSEDAQAAFQMAARLGYKLSKDGRLDRIHQRE